MFEWVTSGIEFFANIISFLVSSVEIFIADLLKLQPFFDFLTDFWSILPSAITDFVMLFFAVTFLASVFISFTK